MTGSVITRDLITLLSLFLVIQFCNSLHIIPDVIIQAFKPGGIQVSIPDVPDLAKFEFHGNINRTLVPGEDEGDISGKAERADKGWWTVEHPNRRLMIGDIVNYHYTLETKQRTAYQLSNLTYTVSELIKKYKNGVLLNVTPQATTKSPPAVLECKPTVTTVREGIACAGQTIFEDNFDTLREDIWQIEQYIPDTHHDHPFVSYQRHMVTVEHGNLQVKASLQQNEPGFNESMQSGTLDLNLGCTAVTESCYVHAKGANILPPVVTGRVSSKQFAFTYGTVYVRAKLPQGDWLYPDLLLKPLLKKYGTQNHASGLLKIASARGNSVLTNTIWDNGNKHLYGGAIIDDNCIISLQSYIKSTGGESWGDEFHVYALRWAPESISFYVDNTMWHQIIPRLRRRGGSRLGTLRQYLLQECPSARPLNRTESTSSSIMAPFDDLFYLTLGVSAGGVVEFSEGIANERRQAKPWINTEYKAQLNFWRAWRDWYDTWTQPNLLVDYVKVVAL